MFGEGARQNGREFEPCEVVTIGYHLNLFSFAEQIGEIVWKAVCVAFYRLVEGLRRDAIYLGQDESRHPATLRVSPRRHPAGCQNIHETADWTTALLVI